MSIRNKRKKKNKRLLRGWRRSSKKAIRKENEPKILLSHRPNKTKVSNILPLQLHRSRTKRRKNLLGRRLRSKLSNLLRKRWTS